MGEELLRLQARLVGGAAGHHLADGDAVGGPAVQDGVALGEDAVVIDAQAEPGGRPVGGDHLAEDAVLGEGDVTRRAPADALDFDPRLVARERHADEEEQVGVVSHGLAIDRADEIEGA